MLGLILNQLVEAAHRCTDERLTAVVDRVRHDGLESSGETTVAVGEERREHEPNNAEVHFFSLKSSCTVDHTALVVWRQDEEKTNEMKTETKTMVDGLSSKMMDALDRMQDKI